MPQTILRASSPITVDGVLDEVAWTTAWSMELEFEVRPGENIAPPVRTEVLATYDDRAVYFGFRAYDPDPASIRAHLSDRDDLGPDDWVLVMLDTFNDERRSFNFVVNPLGVQADFVETETETKRSSGDAWDTIWNSAGRITSWGYAVEIRIPFSSVRFQRADGPQVWGFDAVRMYPRGIRHEIALFPRDRSNSCYLCQALKIQGFDGVTPGRNLEVVPTLTAARADEREDRPDGGLVAGDEEVQAGITARWGITPNMTLSGTVNPDFSQIEADARQLEVNERFALFYPEKRPFFMEGADFFETSMRVLHTRTMRDPDWGVKLTGKESGHTVGAYVVQDAATTLLFPGAEESEDTTLEEENLSAVLRYRHDLGNRFTLGALATARQGDDYHNSVVGIDGDLRLTDSDQLLVQLLSSTTSYPGAVVAEFDQPAGTFDDWAGEITYIHDARRVDLFALYHRVGEDFRADLGFMPQAGAEVYVAGFEYAWIPNDAGWYSHLEVGTEYVYEQTVAGSLLNRESSVYVVHGGPLQSESAIHLFHRTEEFEGDQFEIDDLRVRTSLKPSGDSTLAIVVWWGDHVDYANHRLGKRFRVEPGLSYNLGRHLRLDLEYLFERMTVDGQELYTANITQGTLAYQFSTRTFLRLIIQDERNKFDLSRYQEPGDREPQSEELFVQLLFSYTVNPQTVFFLGYTDDREAVRDDPLTTSKRTIFAKIGYAFSL